MSEKDKSAMDLLSESLYMRNGKKAELSIKLERRRALNAELFQLEQEISRLDESVERDEELARRYMKEHLLSFRVDD